MSDKKDHGTYEREYYSDKWDHITNKETGETFWRDKDEHKTYESDNSLRGATIGGFIGEEVDEYDDDD